MGFVCRSLKHGRWPLPKVKTCTNIPWDFLDYSNWRKRGMIKCHVLAPGKKILLTIIFIVNMSGRFVCSTRRERLRNWACPQILMPKCQNHNKLAALHLGFCKVSHISNHIHAKESLKIWECPKYKLNGWCKHKGHFYINIIVISPFTKINIFAKFCMEVTFIDWSEHPHRSSLHNQNITTSHFDICLCILTIYKLHGSCVYG